MGVIGHSIPWSVVRATAPEGAAVVRGSALVGTAAVGAAIVQYAIFVLPKPVVPLAQATPKKCIAKENDIDISTNSIA